jgi:excisionase family DNA binding protein
MAICTVRDVQELPVMLTVAQVQAILGISRVKAYELTRRAGFPVVRLTRVVRIPRDAFFRWLAAQSEDEATQS